MSPSLGLGAATFTAFALYVTGQGFALPLVPAEYEPFAWLVIVVALAAATVVRAGAELDRRALPCQVVHHHHRSWCYTHATEWVGSGERCPSAGPIHDYRL